MGFKGKGGLLLRGITGVVSVLTDRLGLHVPSRDASDFINMSIQLCTGIKW